jgi:predicted phosphodiesterase
MNIIISITHNKHKLIPSKYIDNVDGEFDMIIHAGDISSTGSKNVRFF